MKLFPVVVVSLGLAALPRAWAQTNVVLENFESPAYTNGPLHGQNGWTTQNVSGTIAYATVSNFFANEGTQSIYLVDNDPLNNPKAWKELTGGNVTNGKFEFAVKESPYTTGRDYWTVVFSGTGSSVANFKLTLSSTSTLTLYGGTNGTLSLATSGTGGPGGNYDSTAWNRFSVQFNESTGVASIYLNGGTIPIMSATNAATNWAAGRYLVCPGASTYTNMGVFWDSPGPEWEYTDKLKYAPPTLVAPTEWSPPKGFASGTFAPDEDVIVRISSSTTRTGNLGIVSGRNVRVIGGDLGRTQIGPNQTTKTVFIEGLRINLSGTLPVVNGVPVEMYGTKTPGCLEMDGMDLYGVFSATGGADIYIQNCSIKGVHGTSEPHGAANPIQMVVCTGTGPGNSFTADITTVDPVTLVTGTNWLIVGASAEPKLNGTYKIIRTSGTTGTLFSGTRWDSHNPLPPPPFGPGSGALGGYLWVKSGTALHADGIQSMGDGQMYNSTHLYRVTIDSNAECFLGMNQHNTEGARSLVMTRVNMAVNNVWPQNYDSACLYIGTTDQSPAKGWGSNGYPVALDRVYIKPRPQRELTRAVYPSDGTTRFGVPIGALTNDGGQTVYWPPALGVTGFVTKSTTGFPGEPGYTTKDYADLTGPNAPGLNYVSPGYSNVPALSLTGITGVPAVTGTMVVPVSATTGTLVTRLDVNFTGEGHVIDLGLTDATGKFGMDPANKRNVVVKGPLTPGIVVVTATASQGGNPGNSITRTLTINVQ